MELRISYFSVKGREDTNEDFFVGKILDKDTAIAVLCDGMGGLLFGDVAARTVAEAVTNHIEDNLSDYNCVDVTRDAIIYADRKLLEIENAYHGKMGTTLASVIVRGDKAYIAWLGNTRVYIVCNTGYQNLLTSDHIVSIGKGNIRLTRCIKGNGAVRNVPVIEMSIENVDKICICSDGYYNLFPDTIKPFEIAQLKTVRPIDDATLAIIEIANNNN